MILKRLFHSYLLTFVLTGAFGQADPFTKQDSLMGSITKERQWWNVTYYHLDAEIFPAEKSIKGSNEIHYKAKASGQKMQIDLQKPLKITRVVENNRSIPFTRNENVFYITFDQTRPKGYTGSLKVFYNGKPKEAENPPWQGGMIWKGDSLGNPWFSTSCQQTGASVWWPCKDHWSDEPDSMRISLTVPEPLTGVSNGRLEKVDTSGQKNTFHWLVKNPINTYGVTLNAADYIHFTDTFQGKEGTLKTGFYVLKGHQQQAKSHFRDQVPKMLEAMEYWFGPYPFYEDGYKLVETPFAGMEHQSAISYGNGFTKGYNGKDLSGTGHGLTFDFIIVHESAHEWFGNSITVNDQADMWVHEAFASYAETLYLEYHQSKQAADEYVKGTRRLIKNDRPIIGKYGVHDKGSEDMYFKGANMLHTLRQIMNDDKKWKTLLHKLNKRYFHKNIDGKRVEAFFNKHTETDLSPFFDQYLRTTRVPVLEYKKVNNQLHYRWQNCVENFRMPLRIFIDGQSKWIKPETAWQQMKNVPQNAEIKIDDAFYIKSRKATSIVK